MFPFTSTIERMSSAMVMLLCDSKKEKTNAYNDFNILEVKIYLGGNMFENEENDGIVDDHNQPLRKDCTKVINYHNDVRFGDDETPKNTDTVLPD